MFAGARQNLANWYNVWSLVILFFIGMIAMPMMWYIASSMTTNPFVEGFLAIVFVFGFLIMAISLLIAISEDNKFISTFILLAVGVLIGVLGYIRANGGNVTLDFDRLSQDFYANFSTEFIGVVITVLAIDSLKDRISWRKLQRGELAPPVKEPGTNGQDSNSVDTGPVCIGTAQAHASPQSGLSGLALFGLGAATATGFLLLLSRKK